MYRGFRTGGHLGDSFNLTLRMDWEPNPYSLAGKRVLITGASSGIGRATAIECSKAGAKLVLVARRPDELAQTLDMLTGGGHEVVPCDLAGHADLLPWMREITDRVGPLHGLVHAAGISVTMPLNATSEKLYRSIMSINLDAAYALVRAFRHRAVHADTSSIVLLASVTGVVGTAGLTAYCASKGGLISFAKAAALEIASAKVRINTISPAWVLTPMVADAWKLLSEAHRLQIEDSHPLGIGEPEDVAYAAIYLLSDAAKWVTGANFAIDGGYTAR